MAGLSGEMDMSGPDMPAKFVDIDDIMGSITAYVCFDCSAINTDPDTQVSVHLSVCSYVSPYVWMYYSYLWGKWI